MKKIIILMVLLAITSNLLSQKLEQGSSSIDWTAPCAEKINNNIKEGIKYIEITINPFYRKVPPEQTEPMMQAMKASIDSTKMRIWSVHLPFSHTLDISVLDDSARNANVNFMAKIIKLSAMYSPRKLVLHPSSEPIKEEDREQRLHNSIASIDILRKETAEIGAQLCIENLPRTCLGRDSKEMKQLVEDFPDVGICFDVNHLLTESQHDFIQALGDKITTVHISDYDYVDEKHWLPGKGKIDWGLLYSDLINANYKGVFMFECDGSAKELRSSYDYIWDKYKKERMKKGN